MEAPLARARDEVRVGGTLRLTPTSAVAVRSNAAVPGRVFFSVDTFFLTVEPNKLSNLTSCPTSFSGFALSCDRVGPRTSC
jgi:hypothetical protein